MVVINIQRAELHHLSWLYISLLIFFFFFGKIVCFNGSDALIIFFLFVKCFNWVSSFFLSRGARTSTEEDFR